MQYDSDAQNFVRPFCVPSTAFKVLHLLIHLILSIAL